MIFRGSSNKKLMDQQNNHSKVETHSLSEGLGNNRKTELQEFLNHFQSSSGNIKIDVSWNFRK